METDAIKKFILQIPFFKAFTDHELNKLVGREKLFKDSKKGGYIFKEGDPGSSLYVLLFGEIDLVKKGEGGTESIILQLKTGALFGEVAMLTGNKRNLDARASSTKVVVMEFTRQLIDKMIPSVQNKFQKQLLFIIAKNLDTMNMRYAKLESSIK
jgi:CRP-like cAMP-binding protein